MSHSALCKPLKTILGRIAHFLNGPYFHRESQKDKITILWSFGEWPHSDLCWINVSEKVTQEEKLTFGGPNAQPDKMTPMVQELFSIKGVATVMLLPYKVIIQKGKIFKWFNLQQPIEDVLRKYLVP